MPTVLFISGSIRRESLNTKLSSIAGSLLPPGFDAAYLTLDEVPPYNGDFEGDKSPASVIALRAAIGDADGVFWTVPEYNYGLPGVVKNAIDWASRPIIPQNCVVGKPMNAAVATTSSVNGVRSLADLKRYWNLLGGIAVPTPDCVVNLAPTKITDDDGRVSLAPDSTKMVRLAVECLTRFIESGISSALVDNWHAYVKAVTS
jgi:chromate reductase